LLVNYWLCVTNEDNWKVVRARKVWGVPERRGKRQIEGVRPGDYLVFYVIPKKIGGMRARINERRGFAESQRLRR
jgi:predicted RNA-binding protein